MIYLLVAIRDNAVDAFQPGIHVVRARGEALRNFTNAVNDQQATLIHQHPHDFDLWILGELNDQDGTITSKPERLARGTDVKNRDSVEPSLYEQRQMKVNNN